MQTETIILETGADTYPHPTKPGRYIYGPAKLEVVTWDDGGQTVRVEDLPTDET